jgi:ABC-type glycerol-3-phosphate transport system substrate-binding protein
MKLVLVALASSLVLAFAACGGSAKKADTGPASDDIPQEITCCVATSDAGDATHNVVPVEQCPEDNRNPVDACNIGPGDAEPN